MADYLGVRLGNHSLVYQARYMCANVLINDPNWYLIITFDIPTS